jgi:hypothetical protein
MGEERQNGFDEAAAGDIQRLSSHDRPNDGAAGRVAEGPRVRHPDDSVLHQSRRKESVRHPPA